MNAFFLSLISVAAVSLLSVVGFLSLRFGFKTIQSITFILVSFAVGALFGDVFFHLIPEMAEGGFTVGMGVSIVAGILVFFGIEKFIQWRHCHHPTTEEHPHPVAWMNLVGDGFHNFLDGLLIASTYALNPVVGVPTTLAIMLHELPQEMGDFGVLIHSGLTARKALFYNLLSALVAVLGVIVFFIFGPSLQLELYLLPLTVGGFLYLAGSDLVPELHKETRLYKSALQFAAILAGLGIMLSLRFFE